jgi:hypothetical protein
MIFSPECTTKVDMPLYFLTQIPLVARAMIAGVIKLVEKNIPF